MHAFVCVAYLTTVTILIFLENFKLKNKNNLLLIVKKNEFGKQKICIFTLTL